MKLPEMSRGSKKGISLIEIILVVTISIVIASFVIPIGVGFYNSQRLNETTSDILVILRRAQQQAISGKNDSSYGLKFETDSYILFQGNSYEVRNTAKDIIFELSNNITTSGFSEVVFSKNFGTSTVNAILTVSFENTSEQIDITTAGKIERI